jgi:hypothetical protein
MADSHLDSAAASQCPRLEQFPGCRPVLEGEPASRVFWMPSCSIAISARLVREFRFTSARI